MKTRSSKALTVRNTTGQLDPDITKKFQEAKKKKLGIEDFVKDYLCQYLSDSTKRAYANDLGEFFGFLKSGGQIVHEPKQIESYHFQLYRDHLIEKGYSSATIQRRMVSVRSFVKWAIAARLMDYNPLDLVRLPKVQTESPTVAFDDIEVLQMISAPDLTKHKGRMNRLAMVLLFNLGLRRNELINIRMGDFYEDRGHKVLKVYGKGDKTRVMPITANVQREIESYLNHYQVNGVFLTFEDFLLQSSRHPSSVPVDGSTIYRMIDKYAGELGINKRVSPHSCRATVISHLLDTQHVPIRDVATFAGHSNITTTERYDKRRDNLDKSAAYEVDYTDDKGVG